MNKDWDAYTKKKVRNEAKAVLRRYPSQGRWIQVAALVLTVMWVLPVGVNGAEGVSPAVTAILGRVQQRYAVSDFEADFVQESHLKAMGMVDTAKGHVYFKPPFMMRWHYQEPEEYMIITDGKTVWIYRPLDRQVLVGQAADYFGDSSLTELFSEPSKLHDRFAVEVAEQGHKNGEDHVLRLTPEKGPMNVQEVFLTISGKTFDIVQSDTVNAFGDSTRLRFSHFAFNKDLAPSLFEFEIPKGTDVMQLDKPY